MKRSMWIGVVLGYVVLALAGPFAMLRETVLAADAAPAAEPPAAAEAGDEAGGGSTVLMEGLAFSPATLTVEPGTTVLFDNQDVAPHTVTAEGAGIDSGVIDPGGTFEAVVEESFEYVCAIHPSMRAEIAVSG